MAEDVKFEWVDGPDNENGQRPATREEWNRIEDLCVERGWPSLNRTLSRVLVAKRDDVIIGFHVLQLFPHAEPVYVTPDEYGTGLAEELADQMVKFLTDIKCRGWMVIADNPHAARLCEQRGMRKLKSPVYVTQ